MGIISENNVVQKLKLSTKFQPPNLKLHNPTDIIDQCGIHVFQYAKLNAMPD
jgi:hypothetical protein